jgi:hypothetical protein
MNITIFTKYPSIACSYYRGLGVLPKLSKLDQHIITTYLTQIPALNQPTENWHIFNNSDIVFIERPVNYEYYSACVIAKEAGAKLWIDFDDDFLNIPGYNPFSGMFNNDQTKEFISKTCELADVVTVATDGLRDIYRKYNRNTIVIPNAFDDYRLKFDYKLSDKKIVNWRGSSTHRGDLLPVALDLKNISDMNKDWEFSFIGNDTWYFTDGINNKRVVRELLQSYYWKYILSLNPSIQIVPLTDNQFNRGKSMCAWLEATYSGAVAVGPDFGDFKRPGVINYRDDFAEKIQECINDEKLRKAKYDESYDYIKDNLLLSTVNKKRLELAEGLL